MKHETYYRTHERTNTHTTQDPDCKWRPRARVQQLSLSRILTDTLTAHVLVLCIRYGASISKWDGLIQFSDQLTLSEQYLICGIETTEMIDSMDWIGRTLFNIRTSGTKQGIEGIINKCDLKTLLCDEEIMPHCMFRDRFLQNIRKQQQIIKDTVHRCTMNLSRF